MFDFGETSYVGRVLKTSDIEYYVYSAVDYLGLNKFAGGFGYQSDKIITKTVDAITGGKAVNFIRADIEGSECKMLRGAAKTIENSPDLILSMEWQADAIKLVD